MKPGIAGNEEQGSHVAPNADGPVDALDGSEFLREVWRLRDEVFGLEAQAAELESNLARTDAARRSAEHRAQAFDEARRERDSMLESRQWRVGGAILGPFRRVRHLLGRR